MSVMTATAVITAVDRASAVFGRVAGAARAAAGRVTAINAAVSRGAAAASTAIGVPGAIISSMAMQGEYEIDKLTRQMQSVGELTEQQREMLKRSAFETSKLTGQSAKDIIEGQRELLQGGLDADTAASTSTMFAKIARANGITSQMAAEDAINVANMLGLSMNTTEEKVASLTKAMEFMSVVPNLSTESWNGLRTSLKYAAPVANALKIPIEELGGALSILADAGFKGEEGGTALRTILTRAIAPTRQARLEMRALGVQLEDLYTFDNGQLGDMGSLAERLRGAGLGQGVNLDKALRGFSDPSKFKNVYDMQDALQSKLMDALGIKKGDAEARGILIKAIQGHTRNAQTGFDLEGYFRGISKMPLQAMKEMFGLQRIAQAEQLKKKLTEILQLGDGTQVSKLRALAAEFERLMPGAIDRRALPMEVGFSYQVDRLTASLANLRDVVFNSGRGGTIGNWVGMAADAVNRLSTGDPENIQKATIAIAGLGPALWGLSKVLASPALMGVIAAGGLSSLLGADLTAPFFGTGQNTRPWSNDDGQSKLLADNAPAVALVKELAGIAGELGSGVGEAVRGIQNLLGLQVSDNVLADGLRLLVDLLSQVKAGAKWAADGIKSLREANPLPGGGGKIRGPMEFFFGKPLLGDQVQPQSNAGGAGRFAAPDLRTSAQRVDVNGRADVEVKNRIEVEVKVDGPGTARVTGQTGNGARASVPLNTGTSMPDTGAQE